MIAAPARGRVLAPVAEAEAGRASRRLWVVGALLALLPLFGETFTYVVDLPPVYALAKIWPLLTLPLAALGAAKTRLAGRGLVIVALAWMAAATPLISMATLGDSLAGAFTGTIKIWSLGGALALSAALAWLKPSVGQITTTLHLLGAATFGLMALIWLAAPPEAYTRGIEGTKVFLWDMDRGYRLNIPIFFGLLWIFLLNRSFWTRPRVLPPILMAIAFILMLTIYKQRTQIGGAAITVLVGPVLSAARRRPAVLGLLLGALVIAAPLVLAVAGSREAASSLGGSLTYRQTELGHALDFLNAQPLRWAIGAGGATRAGDVDLAAIVGAHYFFLSDLGWVGVLFEYGAVGAALMLALHLVTLRAGWKAATPPSPLASALFDYSLYLILVSPVLSVVFAPGELAVCLALLGALAHPPTGGGAPYFGSDAGMVRRPTPMRSSAMP